MHNARGMWKLGDRLTHRYNPELGLGRVIALETRALVAEFPRRGTRLKLAIGSDALMPVDLQPGRSVRVLSTQQESSVAAWLPDGRVRLANGAEVGMEELWPLELEGALVERLAAGDVDPTEDFANRLEALQLSALREAQGLGSFLGGRIRLFPHQLHVAERASAAEPVRWLLADEVGLGKTVEACLVLNRLARTGRFERCLVVAPATLAVQWLGELWRKHHQVFVLLDAERLADVARDFGAGFNPFEAHRRVVVALETLIERPQLTAQAVAAAMDLLVVDEAHRLRRPRGHPGDASWRAVAPIAALGRHVLLLTATPFEDDVHGFFRLLQLLRPDELGEEEEFESRLDRKQPLPPCTSSTRRVDIGGLPPRAGVAVTADDPAGWDPRLALESAVRAAEAPHAVARRQKLERIRRALSSGAALTAQLGAAEAGLRAQAEAADAADPRLAWLLAQAPRWKQAGDKTLVFVADRETLEWLRTALSHRGQLASGVFHEELSPARRDIEVAQFRLAEGPSLLVSTECGGEGRNFEFCRRLVLFDLPWNPVVVEQRIGRLDRIGRRLPVEIVYFRPPAGIGADVVTLFETIGLFREPLAGLEPELAPIGGVLEETALEPGAGLSAERFEALVGATREARSRVREAAYQELHRDRYLPGMAEAILARVPGELDARNARVVLTACERLGFHVERQRGRGTYAIELGNEALVDGLPGVPGGSSFLGSFDREEAVENETLDFFAAGHPLVEGILAHIEEGPGGRVALLGLRLDGERGLGLLALYKEGPVYEKVVFDQDGRSRPEWAAAVEAGRLVVPRMPPERLRDPEWAAAVRRLAAALDPARRPVALAALIVG